MPNSIWLKFKGRFGGLRMLAWSCIFRVLYFLGLYNRYYQIDFSRVRRFIFVCHGNICRSPLGECVADSKGIAAISAGLECTPQSAADERAQLFAAALGLDLSAHKSTRVDSIGLSEHDLVVVMEPAHLRHPLLRDLESAQITLLGLWNDKPRAYIHDPYATNDDFFKRCEKIVTQSTKGLLKHAPHALKAWKTITP